MAATLRLLEDSGIEGLTTNHIAKEAKISIASLYQYFPNKQSILYALHQRWVEWVARTFDEIEDQYFMVVSCPEFFDKLLVGGMEKTLYSYWAEAQLFKAIQNSRELEALVAMHSNEIADRMVKYLKGYGSEWDEKKLKKLGIFLLRMTTLAYIEPSPPTVADRKLKLEWTRKMGRPLIEECLGAASE